MGGKKPSKLQCDKLPVTRVSQDDSLTSISKLNAMTGKKYQLLTKVEWEYAARGGNQSRHYRFSASPSTPSSDSDWQWTKINAVMR